MCNNSTCFFCFLSDNYKDASNFFCLSIKFCLTSSATKENLLNSCTSSDLPLPAPSHKVPIKCINCFDGSSIPPQIHPLPGCSQPALKCWAIILCIGLWQEARLQYHGDIPVRTDKTPTLPWLPCSVWKGNIKYVNPHQQLTLLQPKMLAQPAYPQFSAGYWFKAIQNSDQTTPLRWTESDCLFESKWLSLNWSSNAAGYPASCLWPYLPAVSNNLRCAQKITFHTHDLILTLYVTERLQNCGKTIRSLPLT